MSRLERLLKLAQKTGDTLIVHDEKERDMVIMDVTMYEVLHDMYGMRGDMMSHGCEDCDCGGHDDVATMSEREMLDKINHDIAEWRSYREEDEQWDRASVLEDDLISHPPFDPFEEDLVHEPAWHRAGDILHDRKDTYDIPVDTTDNDNMPDMKIEDIRVNFVESKEPEVVEPEYDELGEAGLGKAPKTDIPFVSHDDLQEIEETPVSDDDEPVFFEEPV